VDRQREFVEADLAWMGLDGISNISIKNPYDYIYNRDPNELAKNYLKVITQPNYLHGFIRDVFGIQLLPLQIAIEQEIWKRTFPMFIGCRGLGKSFLLGVYAASRALLCPGTKIVLTGAGFRQAKLIYEYIEKIWADSQVFRDICTKNSGSFKDPDRWTFRINDSTIIAIPIGDGSRIRGLRANIIIADEFNSIRPDIYETVVQGFASVTATPIENVKKAAKRKYLLGENLWTPEQESLYKGIVGNQSIISGTAGFDFEHFADYWKRYKTIISGDISELRTLLGEEISEHFDPDDFTIIRIPYSLIPEGFMDDKHIMKAKATIHSGIFANEYGAVFSKDSEGFFKRSLIESCVATEKNVKEWKLDYCSTPFDTVMAGDHKKTYIYGIDPASEKDHFCIVILELHKEHARVVYCWTINRTKLKKMGGSDNDYYTYCIRKIRNLMKIFPCGRLGIDTQGGGYAVIEGLHDKQRMEEGELCIWPVIDPDDPQPLDDKPGLHIIEQISFANPEWTATSNHGLRKDLESKTLLFPRFDGLVLSLAAEQDILKGIDKHPEFDSLENTVEEIEELKNELSTIVMTQTGVVGRDRWDTPEIKGPTGRKEKLRKDRYSALLIANMMARMINRADSPAGYNYIGGRAKDFVKSKDGQDGKMYNSEWYGGFNPVGVYYSRK
jgi:hypothetical protein